VPLPLIVPAETDLDLVISGVLDVCDFVKVHVGVTVPYDLVALPSRVIDAVPSDSVAVTLAETVIEGADFVMVPSAVNDSDINGEAVGLIDARVSDCDPRVRVKPVVKVPDVDTDSFVTAADGVPTERDADLELVTSRVADADEVSGDMESDTMADVDSEAVMSTVSEPESLADDVRVTVTDVFVVAVRVF
jgi:hypothetical protein